MAGSLLDRVRRDAKRFVVAGGWEETITLTTKDDSLSISIAGYASKHHINFDSDGLPVNSKNAHICISESDLVANAYPVRNAKGEVSLLNHKISVTDSTGESKNYVIAEHFPDETLGLIVCILKDDFR